MQMMKKKFYVSQRYITNGVDYVMEKFGRYVLQMEFTMLEVYIRRNGKHQIPRKKNIEDSRKTSAQNQKQIMYSALCIM